MGEQDGPGVTGGVPLGPWDGSGSTDDPGSATDPPGLAGEPAPRRRWSRRRWTGVVGGVVAAALVAGGVSYAVVVNRPDYRLRSVLDATAAQSYTGATLSLDTDAASLEALGAPAGDARQTAALLARMSIRVAASGDDAEVSVDVDEASALRVLASSKSVGLVVDWSAAKSVPGVGEAYGTLSRLATDLPGPAGKALRALLAGDAVSITVPKGSADESALADSKAKATAAGQAVQGAVRDHATVADGGSDEHGHRYVVTVPLAPVWDTFRTELAKTYGKDLPAGLDQPLPAQLADASIDLELWESGGVVARTRVDLGPLLARSYQAEHGGALPDAHLALVAVPDNDGVRALPGTPVTVSSDDLAALFLAGMGLGGVGQLDGSAG